MNPHTKPLIVKVEANFAKVEDNNTSPMLKCSSPLNRDLHTELQIRSSLALKKKPLTNKEERIAEGRKHTNIKMV